LERWARSEPHRVWWKQFLKDSGGTGFWHETYCLRGGFEAVYDNIPQPVGFLRFAPVRAAKGGMFTARERMRKAGAGTLTPPFSETELYNDQP
jgi:hypothetical protein